MYSPCAGWRACCSAWRCCLRDRAQEQLAIRSDFLFYGDNTEFRNPFREGETIFGAAMWLAAEIALNERVIGRGGFRQPAFGSENAFERRARFWRSRCGAGARRLSWERSASAESPCLKGPTAAVPTDCSRRFSARRSIRSPVRSGLAWTFAGSKLRHYFWLEWQQLNTQEHRERFDGGIRTSYRIADHVSLPLQLHVVHEGGQLFASGAVADSAALATGAAFNGDVGNIGAATLDLFALASRYVPDRARPDLSRDGVGFFGRAAVERAGWRGHVIFWRGRNFIKEEGDPNYQSITRSGDRYLGTRDYSEAGLTRRFILAPAAVLDVSGRLHRVEGRYGYSYRIQSVVSALWKVR